MTETSTVDLQKIIKRHRNAVKLNFLNSNVNMRKQLDKVIIQMIKLERDLDTLNEMKDIIRDK